jgi:tetratricopeptide (TPR) repeat protein
MGNQTVRHVIRFLTARILAAALAVFWAVTSGKGAETIMTRPSKTVVNISGGDFRHAWTLSYGLMLQFNPLLVPAEGNRAWYSYGGWLRWIDTQKGEVIGRWHFPAEIVKLTPRGSKVQVEIEEGCGTNDKFRRALEFDPTNPRVPYSPTNCIMLNRVPIYEGQSLWPSVINQGALGKITAEEAKKFLPKLEDAVRRDPFTPWFRVGLGKLLRDLSDPRATEVYQEAIKTPASDFTELFAISVYFDLAGENELSRAAFDRGYQDFWQKGNDPRMLVALIARFMVYSPKGNDWGNPATPLGRVLIERMYSLTPYGEGAPLAWRLYADYLAEKGSTEQARLWRARAEDSAQNGYTFSNTGKHVDPLLLLACSSICAAIIYALVLFARYRPQRRLDLAARKRTAGMSHGFGFFHTEYWSRRQRVVFFIIVSLAWFSAGLIVQYVAAVLRLASMPISAMAGSFAGPATISKFENGLPMTPQRDLMLAVAYQQDGQLDKAERLYRSLPQFAESWNNLGVILKEAGKDQEAKATFEKALDLDPKMAEAALNLGRPPGNFWTEQHQKYLPSRPMLAPPSGAYIKDALVGGTSALVFLRALEGPFSTASLGGIGQLL